MRLAHEAAVYFPIGNLALSGSMPCAGGITFFMIMRPKVASCEYSFVYRCIHVYIYLYTHSFLCIYILVR